MKGETTISGMWIMAGAISSIAGVALLLAKTHLAIDILSPVTWIYVLIGVTMAGTHYGLRTPQAEWQRVARDGSEYFGIFALICLLGAVASYPVAAVSRGYADVSLERIDRLLGFDWIGWYGVVSEHPMLQSVGRVAYDSIFVTPALILGYFAWAGRRTDARQFMASFWLAEVLTLMSFPLYPARGPLAALWHGPIPYMPSSALYQSDLIPVLRDHAMHHIDLGALRGLVCAPSFHTASAVLYIAAAWRSPLRWPILAINIAMLLATPVEGTHYLTDMVGGAAVAMLAMMAMNRLSAGFTFGVRRRRRAAFG